VVPVPELTVVGHVTRDEIGPETRLGGAATFAARAASVLGLRTTVVTAAPLDWPPLADLRSTPGIDLAVAPSPRPTTFRLDYQGPRRILWLRERARDLGADDVPPAARRARVAYIAPVAGECPRHLGDLFRDTTVILGLQGWLRRMADDGRVLPASPRALLDDPPRARLAVLSDEDHPDADRIATTLAASGMSVALTQGARGATLFHDGGRAALPAQPAVERDPTGAGDVFALVMGVALAGGAATIEAATLATEAAARVVEGPGVGRLAAFDGARLAARLR
jgi:sugar/nucleoside kinase (ribokinase family)